MKTVFNKFLVAALTGSIIIFSSCSKNDDPIIANNITDVVVNSASFSVLVEEERIALEFFDLKARSAKRKFKSRAVEINLSTMHITNDEIDSSLLHKDTSQVDDEPEEDRVQTRTKKTSWNNKPKRSNLR